MNNNNSTATVKKKLEAKIDAGDSGFFEELVGNRQLFEDTIYTPLNEALKELKIRADDSELDRKINDLVNSDIPEPFLREKKFVILRHLITPTYEINRFLQLSDLLDDQDIKPLLVEYPDDILVPSNIAKRFLCKLGFYKGIDNKGGTIIERINIIDFEKHNGKKISDIKSIWDELLTIFHRNLFNNFHKNINEDAIFNISSWYNRQGPSASKFYTPLLGLFVKHGILFENYILNDAEEREFMIKIFLPAFFKVQEITGKKPLIVPLEPTDMEDQKFWLCYPYDLKQIIEKKLNTQI